jgi:hypothetical protein
VLETIGFGVGQATDFDEVLPKAQKVLKSVTWTGT